MLNGFGFSYVTRRDAWERVKFPAEGTEDYPWLRQLQQIGGKIAHVADYPEGVLHTIHPKSASMVFPQRFLGHRRNLGLGSLRSRVASGMMAGMSGMVELPRGQKIQLSPGVTYSVVAKVKNKHSLKSLAARASTWGISISSAQDNVSGPAFGVSNPSGDYRLVHLTGTAKQPNVMPWKVPAPLSFFDGSCVERAWSSQPAKMVGSRPMFGSSVLPTTPIAVLQYRRVWDSYVLGTIQAAFDCAAAWQAQHDGTQPSTPVNLTQFAVPPDATTLQLWANSQTQIWQSIQADWNAYAGWTAAQVIENADNILQSYQATVLKCGQFWQPDIVRDCPSLPMPQVPGFDVQLEAIGTLEGLGIIGTGALQLIGMGAGGAIEAYAGTAKQIQKTTNDAFDVLKSPWPWVAVAAVGLGIAAVDVGAIKHSFGRSTTTARRLAAPPRKKRQ